MDNNTQPQTPTPPARLLRMRDVTARCGVSRSTIYQLIAAGSFPAPVKFGERVALWPESVVDAWINDLIQKNKGVLA